MLEGPPGHASLCLFATVVPLFVYKAARSALSKFLIRNRKHSLQALQHSFTHPQPIKMPAIMKSRYDPGIRGPQCTVQKSRYDPGIRGPQCTVQKSRYDPGIRGPQCTVQ
jgi:hypothetical protein